MSTVCAVSKYKTPTDNPVAAAVRAELARRNRPQSELADHLKLSQAAVSRRLSGRVEWRLSELAEVATFLNLPIAAFVAEGVPA